MATTQVECWEGSEKQDEFLSADEDIVLYGGSAGGGKTESLAVDALGLEQKSVEWARYRAIIFRRTYPELGEIIDRTRELYPRIYPGAEFFVADREWKFPSGAKVSFGYMDREDHRFKYQGDEYQYIAFDELTHWPTPVCFNYLLSRLRSTNPAIKCFMRATTNPGGAGHGWVRNFFRIPNDGRATNFIQSMQVGREIVRRSIRFIPAKLSDNKYLSRTGYRERLMMLPDKERKRLLDGRWDIAEGQFFMDWDPSRHVVEPFDIPNDWPRWRSLDWGFMKPYCVLWFAMNPEGAIYCYRELYGYGGEPDVGTREDASTVKRIIMGMEAREIKNGIRFVNNPADPSIWTKQGTGKSVAEWFLPEVRWNSPWAHKSSDGQSLKSRVNGWHECSSRLKTETFKVFSTCRHFIRTVPEAIIDNDKPEDVDSACEDHAADAWRYSMVSRHKYRVKEKTKKTGLTPYTWAWLTHEEEENRSRLLL